MKTLHTLTLLPVLALALACPSDDDGRADGETGDEPSTGEPTTTSPTTTSPTTTSPTTTSPTTTAPTTTMTTDPTGTDTTDTEGDGYVFDESDPSEYSQIDRMGMPAVATAVISDKDVYNASDALDDAAGTFVEQIVANLTALHAALDDDLDLLELTPCDVETCAAQGAPLVVPDVIRVDFTAPSGFPNGRLLADPVIDITLAVVLLDLSVHDVTLFAELPLNPPAGDTEPSDEFPYFAAPN